MNSPEAMKTQFASWTHDFNRDRGRSRVPSASLRTCLLVTIDYHTSNPSASLRAGTGGLPGLY